MKNNQDLIKYLKYLGATEQDAVDTVESIHERRSDGENLLDILNDLELPEDLADFFN